MFRKFFAKFKNKFFIMLRPSEVFQIFLGFVTLKGLQTLKKMSYVFLYIAHFY